MHGYTRFSAPPEHRIQCSITTIKDGSHGCCPVQLQRGSDWPIGPTQTNNNRRMIQIPPFTIIKGHSFTVRLVASVPDVAATQTHRRRVSDRPIGVVQHIGDEVRNPNPTRPQPIPVGGCEIRRS
ncbi:hypothetical protein ACLOJK_026951 [Asimina triloba]